MRVHKIFKTSAYLLNSLLKMKCDTTDGIGGDPEGEGLIDEASPGVVDLHGHDVPVAGQETVRSIPHPRARRRGHVTFWAVFLDTAAEQTRILFCLFV